MKVIVQLGRWLLSQETMYGTELTHSSVLAAVVYVHCNPCGTVVISDVTIRGPSQVFARLAKATPKISLSGNQKARHRLYFLRSLKSFGMSRNVLVPFYRGIIESILTTNILVWFGHVSQKDLRKLETVIRSAEGIIGTKLPSLHTLYHAATGT